jgi:Rieske Fe-S protein
VEAEPSRRAVLAASCAAGATVVLAGCETYGGSSDPPEPPAQPAPATTGPAPGAPATTGAGNAPAGPPPLARVDDIPVGGGKIFEAEKVVLTQPQAGTIKAFSIECTHQGCAVTRVAGGTIDCQCHGSKFDVADGSVAAGPAPSPLPPVGVRVSGDAITLT